MTQSIVCASRYTGKERDNESGLDYFGARYYASSMGRFMSPDWASKPEAVPYSVLGDPQSLNLYSYVRNNSLSKNDPDGHCGQQASGGQQDCSQVKVQAKVVEQPKVVTNEKQADGSNRTGVRGTVQDTITENGKPVANTTVTETNKTTATLNGDPHNLGSQEGPAPTNGAGQVNDTVGLLAPAGSAADDKALTQTLTTQSVTMTNTNTITFTTPGGCTCSATATRTLTNVGTDGKPSSTYTLTTTQPVVKQTTPQ